MGTAILLYTVAQDPPATPAGTPFPRVPHRGLVMR